MFVDVIRRACSTRDTVDLTQILWPSKCAPRTFIFLLIVILTGPLMSAATDVCQVQVPAFPFFSVQFPYARPP